MTEIEIQNKLLIVLDIIICFLDIRDVCKLISSCNTIRSYQFPINEIHLQLFETELNERSIKLMYHINNFCHQRTIKSIELLHIFSYTQGYQSLPLLVDSSFDFTNIKNIKLHDICLTLPPITDVFYPEVLSLALTNIEEVSNSHVINFITRFPNLQKLYLTNNQKISDANIQDILLTNCPNIISISIINNYSLERPYILSTKLKYLNLNYDWNLRAIFPCFTSNNTNNINSNSFDLIECNLKNTRISWKYILIIIKYSPKLCNLNVAYIEGDLNSENIDISIHSTSLEYLDIRGLSSQSLNLQTPNLYNINLRDARVLKALTITSYTLSSLNLQNLRNLRYLILYCPELQELITNGCIQLGYPLSNDFIPQSYDQWQSMLIDKSKSKSLKEMTIDHILKISSKLDLHQLHSSLRDSGLYETYNNMYENISKPIVDSSINDNSNRRLTL